VDRIHLVRHREVPYCLCVSKCDWLPGMKCIVLDFDGVILASTEVKSRAFEEIFSRYPDVSQKATAFHHAHKGVSRNQKFQYLVHDLLGLEDPELINQLSEEFGQIVEDRILGCEFVPGAKVFLNHWHGRLPLYVASTNSPQELGRIICRLGLTRYFDRVLADPGPKAVLLQEILNHTGLVAAEVVFVGDSAGDLEAAREVGARFVGVGDCPAFQEEEIQSCRDLFEVAEILVTEQNGVA
jgi:phosphoglycolate phosphatase